ncbi:MAG TPA: SAM-dependent chlorinase/fluorinase [Acidimicrobiia bacterium]|nr:SAM-dependent chlorinase/fluorinase [Acidimicrobiia bacterium]
MPPTAPIAFLSDYGLADEFVGVVHGVILRIAPEARVIDVTHQVRRGDVRAGALALVRAVQYLPPGVALAVVDPGVGTGRRALAVSTPWGFFVGPDNGLLAPAVAMIGGAERVVSLEDPRFRLPGDGLTFEGRDVFAPAAAVLAAGQAGLDDLGPEVAPAALMPLLLPLAEVIDGEVHGLVWWVDAFGNCQTNMAPDDLRAIGLAPGDTVAVEVAGTRHEMVWQVAYGPARAAGVVHVDSYGLVAVAVPGGRADEELGLVEGTPVAFGRAES